MSTLITNDDKKMVDALKRALEHASSVDILVGYFFFSGFQLLAEELKDKKVRILVGLELDPTCIPLIIRNSKEGDESLEKYGPREPTKSVLALQQNYEASLIGLVNESETFDTDDAQDAFDMFMSKIEDGSLEIRKTKKDDHSKLYIFHSPSKPGRIVIGSSNFTYRGLKGQGELNITTDDVREYQESQELFNGLWESGNSINIVDKSNSKEFVQKIHDKIWIYQEPTPFEMYLRVLHELYQQSDETSIRTPKEITNGLFMDFEYQTDAVKIALKRIDQFDGVIVADVVGLGKSIIASTVANNLGLKTVVISPPHLIPQWEDYKVEFKFLGPKIYSAGKIQDVFDKYSTSSEPLLIIVDEAHRFRNEDTFDYKMLHQICRSHPENKVLLLTATPFNNSPKDVFALMKLFQTPGQATIRSVDNLSLRFRELITRYKKLQVDMRKDPKNNFEDEKNEISREQRKFLEPIVIRRSRLDLENITRYRTDLQKQGISFPEIYGPLLLEYDLGALQDSYLKTLTLIGSSDSEDGFMGARYQPVLYIKDMKKFRSEFGEAFDDMDLRTAQTNLADFMRKLLVMRFESSKKAFEVTLNRMIANYQLIINWWENLGYVPIMKKGNLPDPIDFTDEDGELLDDLELQLDQLRQNSGLIEVPIDWMDSKYISDIQHDIAILESIKSEWFDDFHHNQLDPKLDEVVKTVQKLLKEHPERKIVIFSSYADTVEYVAGKLTSRGLDGVLSFTAAQSNKANRKVLLDNFDASLKPEEQKNDYKILVCTDALSEGVNLHRAGVVINYDIPYNPTRVIQRIGRINRINKKVFDRIEIYNFFPTVVGEPQIRIAAISTLKVALINNIVGADTRVLTPDEDLQTFFQDEFKRVEVDGDQMSWDTPYIEAYEAAIEDRNILDSINKIPRRARIGRTTRSESSAVVFSKRGSNLLFATSAENGESQLITNQEALEMFKAEPAEIGVKTSTKFTNLFEFIKRKMEERPPVPPIAGRRKTALEKIEAIKNSVPASEVYCTDLIKIIREYDDVSEGSLKDISQIREKNAQKAYEKLQAIVPVMFITNVFERVQRADSQSEVIVLSEEFLV